MWWYVKKKINNDEIVVYTYGAETREQTGEILYDRKKDEFRVLRIADNDTQMGAEWLFQHLYRLIFKENCPDEQMIAIG